MRCGLTTENSFLQKQYDDGLATSRGSYYFLFQPWFGGKVETLDRALVVQQRVFFL